jgi:metacaspase-1
MRSWVGFLVACFLTMPLAGPANASSRALLVGVGDVRNNPLPGIDVDIENMRKVAVTMHFEPENIKVLLNEQATSANVHSALASWIRDGVGPNDRVLIYFSTHGTRVADAESANGVDDAIVMHDTVPAKGRLINVLLGRELGAAIASSPSRNVLVLVDACHSGTATRDLQLDNLSLGTSVAVKRFYTYPGMPAAPPAAVATRGIEGTRAVGADRENYAALSAARDDETASGTDQGGMFTLGIAGEIQQAARDGKQRSVEDLRAASTAYIAAHLKEADRSHPTTDGNRELIRGALVLIPLKNGAGPTWKSLVALAGTGEAMHVSAAGGPAVHIGEKVMLEVNVPRAGFLNVVTIDSQDRATVLYPNKYNPANQVAAGVFRFPTPQMNFLVRAAEPAGPSLVVAFLTSKKVNLLDLGVEGKDAAGKMQEAFTEVNGRATRALVIEAREEKISAGTLTLQIDRAAKH